MTTIFISIAAYEDPQLLQTIHNALNNASSPTNIYFGVALQYTSPPDLSEIDNVKTISYDPHSRPGIVRVRYEISKLYSGEDFYLQIDSHYNFAPGWDDTLVQYYNKIRKKNKISKLILLPLEPYPDGIMTSKFRLALEQGANGMTLAHPHPVNGKSEEYEEYHEVSFARVGQIFLPGSYIKDIGLDPYSHIIQEIFYFSFRSIMSGYRVFQLNKKVLWQDDKEYYQAVWGGKEAEETYQDPNRFKSDAVYEQPPTWYEMSLAIIYNDFSKYAIKNPVMSPEEFWKMQGAEQEYYAAKAHFDLVLHNNL